jgi:mRNA interferase RelE/StbE
MENPYRIQILPAARRSILREPPILQRKVRDRIAALAGNPRSFGVIKLKGETGYRLRIGSHRVLFTIDGKTRTVVVTNFDARKDIYRR